MVFHRGHRPHRVLGKLGDMIVIDRDVLTCPLGDIRDTRVLYTIVGGKVVYERKE